MDILSHAIAGAASGHVFGHEIYGALFAVLPDAVLGLRRKVCPTQLYKLTHSLASFPGVLVCLFAAGVPPTIVHAVSLAWLSHIVLDIPTHGKLWAPRVLYPFTDARLGCFAEWEFFSPSWHRGLIFTILWSVVCFMIAPKL